ncbi:MAG: response regulator [Pyrinomonadaceae bacterium]
MTQQGTKPISHNLGTVLLAEDDYSIRRLLEVILHRAGYNVISAEDGAAALEKALENGFDIAVLDAMMPNLNGYELCRIFRQHPNFQNRPLVILSGLENETVVDADVCLLKTPTMQDELLQVLAKLLEKRDL